MLSQIARPSIEVNRAMKLPSDADGLEEKIRAGDAQALAEFATLHRAQLMRALERKVGSGLRKKLDLEDILQEVLARGVKDLGKVDFDGQDPLGWLYRLMDRQIVDLHRYHFAAQKRDAAREVSANQALSGGDQSHGFAELLVASMTSPSAAVSRDMRLARVHEALEKLSAEMRDAVRWRYLENLPTPVIAQRLGKSDVATRVLLSRAVRKLQKSLLE
jgi:RNA polymerase sigma-70 factor (ECF subfamily)